MTFTDLHFHSNVLGKKTSAYVLAPQKSGTYPVFYLLHGLSDDHTIWLRRTRIETYVEHLPLIVVMPDGGRGFYTNHVAGPAYATHMAEELPEVIESTFHAKTTGKARCIGGLSMGGYGAMRLALGYPGRYVSANSHSGALMIRRRIENVQASGEFDRIFGKKVEGSEHDLVALAKKAKRIGKLPKIRIDCGTEDFLIQSNREFHAALTNMNVPHEYEEFPGEHNWDYWDLHVRQALAFHCKAMGIS